MIDKTTLGIDEKLQKPGSPNWESENKNQLSSVIENMTLQKSVELLLFEQNKLLRLIASGKPMDECLRAVCTSVSKLHSGVRACILVTDDQRLKFPRSITPDFPSSFGQGLKDAPINELAIGTCGTAVYSGKPVICTDIAKDTRWSQGWRDLCVAHGILACHSTPILGVDNLPLGSLMLCFNEARPPTEWEYRLAEFGTQIASIVFEREQSNRALRESEEKYRTLFNSMGEAFALCQIILEDDGKPYDVQILEVNPAHETMTGLTTEETIAHTMRQLIPNLDQSWYETCGCVASGETIRFESYVSSLSRWFDIYAYKVGQNNDHKFALIYRDITERKQTETALRQNEERLRLAVEVGRMVAWEWNPSTDTMITTDNFSSLYGLSKIETVAQEFALVHPEDRARHQSLVENAVEMGKGYHSVFRLIRPDNGEIVWLEERGEVWRDEQGNVQKLIGIVIDITERQQAVKALRDSEELKQRILESSNDCIKVISLNCEILYMNPGGLCLVEIDDFKSVCNANWLSFWQGEDQENAKSAIATAKAGNIGRFKGYCPTMKGKPKWWDVVVTPIRDASGEVTQFVAISRDITQEKLFEIQQQQKAKELTQLNQSLMRTTELLAERNQELNSFTYIVSHDLKAPLRAISNLSQWIEDDLQELLDEDNQRQMQLLRNRVERMEAMIDGLLAYSRVGRTEVETQHVKVNELLDEILDSLVVPPKFTIKIQADLPTIRAKRLLLTQVFANLITNAIKHHPRPDGKLEITATCKGHLYEFAVCDDGDGIAPENHEKIFGIFQTLNARDVKESTGVGLSIVKKIVETEGGKITVLSELGNGATFCFTWPK